VPDGYFNSLVPRIADKLPGEHRSFYTIFFSAIRKTSVWSPVLATALVVLTFFFIIPAKNGSDSAGYDTLAELNIGYDASFAEEVLLAESNLIEAEIENSGSTVTERVQFAGIDNLTDEEISDYLKEQEIETELLTDK
jgi:hypothetical protein